MAIGITKLTNMVDPEVMADMISASLEAKIRFSPLAKIDRTLVGRPGSTITVPKFMYIGDAEDVLEGAEIPVKLLTTSSEPFTIKKAGIGVEITDESLLSGLGDPLGEANKQMSLSIANKIDNDVLTALADATLIHTTVSGTGWTVETINAAIDMFDDEDDEPMVLLVCPADASLLRKDLAGDWDRASDLGDNVLVTGTYGGVLGAQVVRTKKLTPGIGYLIKAGALSIFMKRDVLVETDRDIITKTTVATADEHYGVYLYDESKAVEIIITP